MRLVGEDEDAAEDAVADGLEYLVALDELGGAPGMGRYREMQGDTWRYGEIQGGMARYMEV